MSTNAFRPGNGERPLVEWMGPVSLSYYEKQGKLQLEAWIIHGGEQRCVRSFSLFLNHMRGSPAVIRLLEKVLESVKDARTGENHNGERDRCAYTSAKNEETMRGKTWELQI